MEVISPVASLGDAAARAETEEHGLETTLVPAWLHPSFQLAPQCPMGHGKGVKQSGQPWDWGDSSQGIWSPQDHWSWLG